MKKIIFFIAIFFSFFEIAFAQGRQVVELKKCVDGDTAWFYYNNNEIKVRFLAINTPESTNKIEAYGKEASEYTCNRLMNAKKIELEYDDNSDLKDKYGRDLVWVFVDDSLLNKDIVENGYGEVKYIYGDYKYLSLIKEAEEKAKKNNVGIWKANSNKDKNTLAILAIILILIICLILGGNIKTKSLKKFNNEIKKDLKKELKKRLK